MSDVDSDGFPVSPWSSRFVEIRDIETEEAIKRFADAVGRGFGRLLRSFEEFTRAFPMEQISALALLFESYEREARTRRVVQAQRRRRHR